MRRLLFLGGLLLGPLASAQEVELNVRVGGWQFQSYRRPPMVRAYPVWGWVPVLQVPPAPPPAPPPPQIIYVEREPAPLPPPAPPPPPAPQVVVVHVAPEPAPAPAPVAVVAVPPPGPRVPGPDVFSWTDDDGVVHYSTRVPPDAKKRAKKLAVPAK